MAQVNNRTANLISALAGAIVFTVTVMSAGAFHHHFAKQGWCADLRDGQREMCMLSMDAGKAGPAARAEAEGR